MSRNYKFPAFDTDLSQNKGKFYPAWGTGNFVSLENFAGKGFSGGLDVDFGISIGYTKWNNESYEWRGGQWTVGVGLSVGLGTATDTFTTITFPSIRNYTIDYSAWGINLIGGESSEGTINIENDKTIKD